MPTQRRVTGFAELIFAQSAHLALARATELSHTDIASARPEAFTVDDRRLGFSLDATLGAAELEALRRLLEALVREASAGEVGLRVDEGERLVLRAGPVSDAHRLGPQASGPVGGDADESESRPTIRTEAG